MREIRLSPLGQHLSLAEIRGIVHPVAQRIGARILTIDEPDAARNFVAVMLDEPQPWATPRRIYLLYSLDYDAWAAVMPREFRHAADPGIEWPPLGWTHLYEPEFLDHEGIIAAMADFHGIEMWSSYDLSMAVPGDFPQRSPNDVAYWQPRRLGDALFNWWD
ncbi:hypothetical protein IEQ11_18530 [Lysobacter capsici]|uniref:hypothetical protein n=1 Tax=Lysobacter capsici TaxID=435897 RepID=UPI0007167345|nr:hypothetical protein [Lysobacter capsici]ALN87292.1 hypothetical protein LC55x_4041 [Lysobacter capsici]UOF13722.1 hypothetical protein IEQ11_18530 [Lysobacter capsici]